MDKLLDTLNTFLKSAGQAIASHAPQVWDTTLNLIWWNALFHIVFIGVLLSTAVIVWVWPFKKLYVLAVEELWDEISAVWCLVLGCINAIFSVFVLTSICASIPYILALIDPRFSIMYSLAQKAGLL